MQSKDEHELVWNCCNPFVAALLAAAQGVHKTPAERMVGVWDTQFYSSCGIKQPDQSICAIACRPSEHIAVGYNEVVYERLDRKHIGKMGQYLKTALEENQQLKAAYGLLMCKSAVQVHRIVSITNHGTGWPFIWESSPELVLQAREDGEVPRSTQLWLAHWANCIVEQSNKVATSYEIIMENGTVATAAFGAYLGQGASSSVFSCQLSSGLDEENVVLKVLHPKYRTKEPRELHLLRRFSGERWCPTLKGVTRQEGYVVAIAMEHAGHSVARGGLTQSMFKALIGALETIHAASRGQGDDSVGWWVHCDVRPANVTTKGPALYLLDLGACTWSTEPDHYVGTFHCASDEILDYLVDDKSGRDVDCPRSPASDLVSAVRTAMLLSLGVTVHDAVYAVPVEEPGRMKHVWQQVTPPAWQTAIQHAKERDYSAVVTAVETLLPNTIPGTDAEVATPAEAAVVAVGAGVPVGGGRIPARVGAARGDRERKQNRERVGTVTGYPERKQNPERGGASMGDRERKRGGAAPAKKQPGWTTGKKKKKKKGRGGHK